MTPTRRTRAWRPLCALGVALVALGLTACGPTGDDSQLVDPNEGSVYPQFRTFPEIDVVENVVYAESGAVLDVCVPTDESESESDADGDTADKPARDADGPDSGTGTTGATPASPGRPAIVSIHGGSWQRGDKGNLAWRSVCQWFASEGFLTVSINYRFAPEFTFPAQYDDAVDAVEWLREPEQIERYQIDPTRIGAFGGSAGGHLAAMLGTTGEGDWSTGSRVAAVADLSGPVDLRRPIRTLDEYTGDFARVQLDLLGCADFAQCPQAETASPVAQVDDTDPPFFVAHSIDEFIPLSQSDALVETLRDSGIDVTYVTVEGNRHSLALFDENMQQRTLDFFTAKLAQPNPGVVIPQPTGTGTPTPAPTPTASPAPVRGAD